MTSKTKAETRKENLKKAYEWEERIKEMGHPDEKRGIKAVKQLQKEDEDKQEKQRNKQLEKITKLRRNDWDYKAGLCGWGAVVLHGVSMPKGFRVQLFPTKKGTTKGGVKTEDGVVIGISAPSGFYARGVKLSYHPRSDMIFIEEKLWDALDYVEVLSNPEGKKNGRIQQQ